MSLELPPRSDHDSGSGSLHSKDFVPRRLEKVTFPQKGHVSPYRNRPVCFLIQEFEEQVRFACSYGHNQSECHPQVVCLICLQCVSPRHVVHTHTHIRERAPYPNCSVSRVATISLVSSLQILERPGLILHNIVWFYRVISLWLWIALFCVYRISFVFFPFQCFNGDPSHHSLELHYLQANLNHQQPDYFFLGAKFLFWWVDFQTGSVHHLTIYRMRRKWMGKK